MLTNRLALIIDKLISENQSAFIGGRYILESVVTAHEVLHSTYKSGNPGLVLKLEYEKAFDKVKWPFLFHALKMKKFPEKND